MDEETGSERFTYRFNQWLMSGFMLEVKGVFFLVQVVESSWNFLSCGLFLERNLLNLQVLDISWPAIGRGAPWLSGQYSCSLCTSSSL